MKKAERIQREILELSATLAFMLTEREHGGDGFFINDDLEEEMYDDAKETFIAHRHEIHTQLQNLRKMIQNTHDE